MGKRVWVTGYRAWELNVHGVKDPKLAVVNYALHTRLVDLLDDDLEWVITGGELGVEQWAAQQALTLKADYPALQVAVMLPFADFGHQWNAANQAQLATLVQAVDFSAATSSKPYTTPGQLAQYTRFMAQHTDLALLVYDPDYPGKPTFAYQAAVAESARRPYPLQLINMADLEDDANTLGEQQNSDSQN